MTSTPTIDCIILCLNEAKLAVESTARILKEGHRVILVDNGSDEAERDHIAQFFKARRDIPTTAQLISLTVNRGASHGRNAGLWESRADYVFLLDGDILYIPKTIERLLPLMPEDAGCLGVHNPEIMNGTLNRDEADQVFPKNPGPLFSDFDMAWTQYGLFNGPLLRELRFVDEGPFGEAGNGYEDDWLWHEMNEKGLKSYYVPHVLYYHERHGGQRWLDQKGIDNKNAERKRLFQEKWGSAWYEKPRHSEYEKYRNS